MSAVAAPRPARTGQQRRHTVWIGLGTAAGTALVIVLCAYGLRYYVLSSAARITSPLHRELKPSGSIGHPLGILGGILLLLMYLYPLRKRWKWLSKKGKTKHWLDYHILMGLTAPFLIAFHASFKFQGIAGLAFWIMASVVCSGIVGRFLYGRIPRKLDAAEMSLDEMERMRADLARQLESQNVLSAEELKPLLALPRMEEVQRMSLPRALAEILRLDLRRAWLLWKLRRSAGAHVADNAALKRALAVVRKQAGISRDIVFLSKMHQLFHLWHVVHRPFSYSFALLATLHVLVVTFLGYY